jgi:DNA-binding LacI/PurR family transcriptional regulator
VLEWFSAQPMPAFALFGRRRGLAMAGAGPDKVPATLAATRALLGLGHRRLVLLMHRRHRLPRPGPVPSAFLDELKAHGIRVGAYHLPDWEESKVGFQACLTRMFALTPPTALIVDEVHFFAAAHQFLAQRRLRVPQDVSLVSTDDDPAFIWCEPSVAHIRWNAGPVVRRVVHWAAHVSAGQRDVRQSFTPARFVPGGTIGPAPAQGAISSLGAGIT